MEALSDLLYLQISRHPTFCFFAFKTHHLLLMTLLLKCHY